MEKFIEKFKLSGICNFLKIYLALTSLNKNEITISHLSDSLVFDGLCMFVRLLSRAPDFTYIRIAFFTRSKEWNEIQMKLRRSFSVCALAHR